MQNILRYMASTLLIVLLTGMVAGWTMQAPIEKKAHCSGTIQHTGHHQLYSIGDIQDWMFMRQSESSTNVFQNHIVGFKYINQLSTDKPSNKLMCTSREGTLAQTVQTVISHSAKTHNYYYVFSLRRIIL